MNPRTHALPLLAAATGLALSATAGAETVIANFTVDSPLPRAAAYDPNGLDNLNAGWTQSIASVDDPYTFRYDISGLGIGLADELLITVDTAGSTANLNPAAGNGIAVVGGNNDSWWEATDGTLNFTVVIEDAANADITGSFKIDLTGASIRWTDTDPASVTLSVAGSGPFSCTSLNQAVELPVGQTAETSFSATRTENTVGQFQQLRFNISSGPDVTAPVISATSPADDAT